MCNSHTILTYPHTLMARSRGLALTSRVASRIMTAEEREAGDIWQEGLDEEFAAIEGNTSSGEEGNTSDEDSDGVDLNSNPLHSSPTRSLAWLTLRDQRMRATDFAKSPIRCYLSKKSKLYARAPMRA